MSVLPDSELFQRLNSAYTVSVFLVVFRVVFRFVFFVFKKFDKRNRYTFWKLLFLLKHQVFLVFYKLFIFVPVSKLQEWIDSHMVLLQFKFLHFMYLCT